MDDENGPSFEEQILNLMMNMLDARREMLSSQTLRSIQFSGRSDAINRYLATDSAMLDIITRMFTSATQTRNFATTMLTYAATVVPNSFMDAVPIVPTARQIQTSLETLAVQPGTSCAICQEVISSGAVKIRQCGHVYHRTCISSWFSMSVRCPVCRHDIRESGPVAQTSVDEEQTSTQ
jgi:hypothetical protein